MKVPAGCHIERIGEDQCRSIIRMVSLGTGSEDQGLRWLLAHCDDGITWGRWDPAERLWITGDQPFPGVSPKVSEDNLIELRLFGQDREILLWRTHAGFAGRCLYHRSCEAIDSLIVPAKEERILAGDRLLARAMGFSHVSTPNGSEQVVPLDLEADVFGNRKWPLRLTVWNYFSRDEVSGTIRIAASRLANVYVVGV